MLLTLTSLLFSGVCSAQLPDANARPSLTDALAVMVPPVVVEPPEFVWGRVLPWYRPCGEGVRPFLLWGKPHLGSVFRIVYHIFSLPREDGVYATPGAWVVLSTMPPRNYEEPAFVFPNGCVLLWDLSKSTTLVWGFGGVVGYKDIVMERALNGRTAVLTVPIPNDRAFAGQRVWTQMLAIDGTEVKTSQLIEVLIGDPVSGPR